MGKQVLDQQADTPESTADDARVGKALRRLRRDKGLSLKELALKSGVSVGMLSQIERDLANPSLRLLTQIRTALGVTVSDLFDDAPPPAADPTFVRRADRRGWLELGYLSKELLSPHAPHNLQFMILHIPPGSTSGDQPLSYPAEKGGMILNGSLILKVKDREVLLHQGDSFLFDSLDPHSFRNPTDETAQVLWIIGAVRVDRQL
ncbi:MAG TPA: XRE family transcriptional regulator [Rhodopila sp.]|uniref:helix-turn-helix domain-containing protein n=1 Tax=Rhodopila sp. TaxID=2480087 RepID=UPI002D0BF56D|nr:XRE family transcriptional regulator [Rhodopila sp.]HVY15016.1 XRE family transcriptional regulator [Rhodopila sp.]